MSEKLITTIRFNPDGVEAELYQKIQQGKQLAGLSAPEYVKTILFEYFEHEERQREERSVLQEIREEYQKMADQLEKVVRQSIQEHDAVLLVAINRFGGTAQQELPIDNPANARLPEAGEEIPEGTLDFLDKF